VIVRDNVIEGGECACAFTGLDGGEFTGNTVIRPTKWIFRILQENTGERFKPCGRVKIANNTITFRRADVAREINLGEHVDAASFRFEGNRWLAEDQPEKSKPVSLPVEESGGSYGK